MSGIIDEMQPQQPTEAAQVQRRLMAVLYKGGRYSTRQLTVLAVTADPRATIRTLKRMGWDIQSEWRHTGKGSMYKVYWLNPKQRKDGNDGADN